MTMKTTTSIILAVFLLHGLSFSQAEYEPGYTPPYPEVSWDSLKAKLTYTELLTRAAVNTFYIVAVSFDTAGTITDFKVLPLAHDDNGGIHLEECPPDRSDLAVSVTKNLEAAFRSVKWKPAIYKGQAIEKSMHYRIYFHITSHYDPDFILIQLRDPLKFRH